MLFTVIKNISAAALSLWIISLMIFLLSKAIPGDPVEARIEINYDSASQVNYNKEYLRIKKELKLDLPAFYFAVLPSNFPTNLNASFLTKAEVLAQRKLLINTNTWNIPTFRWHGLKNQYHTWIFQPGNSRIDGRPVMQKVKRSLVWTLFLVFTSIFLSYLLGILIGMGLSLLKNKRVITFVESVLFGIYAIPVFWLATLLMVFFTTTEYGAWTNIFPSVGLSPIDLGEPWYVRIFSYGRQLILPSFVLVLHNLAFLSTLTKRNIDKGREMGFVQTAKAYGFSEREVLFRDVLPFSLLPLITSVTSSIPAAIGGSVVIEIIFNIPGMGRLLYNGILKYDWPIVFPVVMLIAVITFISFLLADILYRVVDPRIKK